VHENWPIALPDDYLYLVASIAAGGFSQELNRRTPRD